MRMIAFENAGKYGLGVVEGKTIVPLGTPAEGAEGDMTRLIAAFCADPESFRRSIDAARQQGTAVSLSTVRLLAPIARPGKIVGIGRNYRDHVGEGGLEHQEAPRIFFKPSGSVSGPGETVRRPPAVTKLDFEGELVVVVGKTLRMADAAEAALAIAGFTVGNDLSARELQFDVKPPQTSFAKGMDGFAAIGPWIVTADELGAAPDLAIRTRVNGELMQEARTSDLIFPIAECLAYVSRYMTLEPGDLLFSGTPAGVGIFRNPPRFLQPGDTVEVEIEKIGVLVTHIGV